MVTATHRYSGILRGASWYFSEKALRLLGGLIVSAWVARYLGPEQYGTLGFCIALIGMLSFAGSLGLEGIVVRDLIRLPQKQNRIVATYFYVRLAGAATVPLLAYGYIALTHDDSPGLVLLSSILSLVVMFSAFDVMDCWLQAHHKPREISLVRIGSFTVGMLLKIVMVVMHAPLIAFAIANAMEAAVVAIVFAMLMKRAGLRISVTNFDPAELRKLLWDGRSMVLSGLMVAVYSKVDMLVLGAVISKEALGSYAVAIAIYGAWNTVGTSLAQVYGPHITDSHRAGKTAYFTELRRFLRLMFLVAALGSISISICSEQIFAMLVGPRYVEGPRVLSILIWGSIPVFMGIATTHILVNEQLYWVSLLRTSLGTIVSVLLIVPASTLYGGPGAAAVVVISATIIALSFLFSKKARQTLSALRHSSYEATQS